MIEREDGAAALGGASARDVGELVTSVIDAA